MVPTLERILANPFNAELPEDSMETGAVAQMLREQATKENFDDLWRYARRLPIETALPLAQELVQTLGCQPFRSTVFGQWMSQNAAAIQEFNKRKP